MPPKLQAAIGQIWVLETVTATLEQSPLLFGRIYGARKAIGAELLIVIKI